MMVWKVVDRTVLLGSGLEILMGWCSIAGSMARGFARVAAGRLVGDGEYGSKEIGTRSSSDKRLRKWRWRKGDFAAKSGRRHYMRALKISGEGNGKTGTGDGGMDGSVVMRGSAKETRQRFGGLFIGLSCWVLDWKF